MQVTPTGLSIGDDSISWSDIRDVRIGNGRIRIATLSRSPVWENLSIASIPDSPVLIALINQLRAGNR